MNGWPFSSNATTSQLPEGVSRSVLTLVSSSSPPFSRARDALPSQPLCAWLFVEQPIEQLIALLHPAAMTQVFAFLALIRRHIPADGQRPTSYS
jgi:hypothetical protein